MKQYTYKGIKKIIALIAFIFLGKVYSNGFNNVEFERITYKYASVYPDLETMNAIEKKMLATSKNNQTVSKSVI